MVYYSLYNVQGYTEMELTLLLAILSLFSSKKGCFKGVCIPVWAGVTVI